MKRSEPTSLTVETHEGKIVDLSSLAVKLETARAQGKSVVHCHGVFDLLHPGHIHHFAEARRLGDLLVVTVTPDRFVNKGPGRPAFREELRLAALAALSYVDFVALSESPTAVECIRLLRPDIYAKGSEYEDAANDVTGAIDGEVSEVERRGGQVHFTRGEVYSSSVLINRFLSPYPEATRKYLQGLVARHTAQDIIALLRGLSDMRVLVVGDAIIDQYSYCEPLGKSPRESIIASRMVSEEQFAGGSVAVANHLAGFCREITLVAALNPDDGYEEYIRSRLAANVRLRVLATPDRPTVQKRRFIDHTYRTKMFEVQLLDDKPYPQATERVLEELVRESLSDQELVVVCDFGHGLLGERLRAHLAEEKVYLALNTQTNSANLGFNSATRYRRADYLCLHELELRISTHSQHGRLPELAERLMKQMSLRHLMVTRGFQGTSLYTPGSPQVDTPALASQVVDRVGAGDSVFSITAPMVARGIPQEVVGLVANCMGALAVQIVCNREPVAPQGLFKFISHVLKV